MFNDGYLRTETKLTQVIEQKRSNGKCDITDPELIWAYIEFLLETRFDMYNAYETTGMEQHLQLGLSDEEIEFLNSILQGNSIGEQIQCVSDIQKFFNGRSIEKRRCYETIID